MTADVDGVDGDDARLKNMTTLGRMKVSLYCRL